MNDDRLGPYRLLRRLGEGGMGVVHLAVDPQGRQVAVKVLRGEVAGDEVARRRLSREVETMRRVRSKYIAEVVDADVTGHRPYIVTRYVPGRPLDEIVKDDGPLDLPALVRVAHGVAAALASVHSVGVIHRDLKPGNVLILDGEPVLIDFGIAQAVDATRLTQTGMFIGTPGYLAPEIIEGQEAGPEVDVHAWAGTLLFAATGQPPFGKGTLEMVFYNITAGKADISAAPATLQPLLKAAFQRNPAKRPKAAELAEQTARMLPQPPPGSVPDEISTVPRPPETPPPHLADRPSYDISTPAVTPRRLLDRQERQPTIPPQDQPYVSLLPGQDAPNPLGSGVPGGSHPNVPAESLLGDGGDPWPTRRVTPEELRRIQRENAAAAPPQPPVQPVQPWPGPQSGGHQSGGHPVPSGEEDVPTRRVRPGSPELGRSNLSGPNLSGPNLHGQGLDAARLTPGVAGPVPDAGRMAPGYDPAARVGQGPDVPEYGRHGPMPMQPPPYIPAQPHYHPDPTQREPYLPGVVPGNPLQRSRAYGVAGGMLLVIMVVAAALEPLLVAIVAVPLAVLLRAADIAQPQLAGRRPAGAAALDVLRVFAHPAALAKSAGITLALTLYALILGLPVTLLLTVVTGTSPSNALAWGAAVALWTVCAGPGVEGPGKQMRRTLASLVPSRTAAMVMAGVLAAVAALSLILAISTFGDKPRGAGWTPLNVDPVTKQLENLRGNTGG
ncbi:protein kinase [Nonomuraea sp. LP-02]|uniref:serine/threonine-protein kinase n=1 Tax=Nonomuraea sp. LP-02 TaxID=3097960 RepID=UPI002E32B08F|nr:protein kinase [Nonomuraea sp. LP-02]MED7930027.1 protein kinase [Nonomuraea sp. LP-02]